MKEYAIYKGDEIIGIGTAKELAEKLKVKRDTIYFWKSPTNLKRTKKGRIAIVIEEG